MARKTTRKQLNPLPSALTVGVNESCESTPGARSSRKSSARGGKCCSSPAAEPAVTPETHETSSENPVTATFVFCEPHATQVYLSGEFNGWAPNATPMTRKPDGHWEAALTLRPGRYQYKYVVDGQWLPDPEAREQVPNEYGSWNSVIVVG